jgi:hypothetical protein
MARNGRGDVRLDLVFAVLLVLIAYARGVSVRDSSMAELAGAGSEGDKSRADVSGGSMVQKEGKTRRARVVVSLDVSINITNRFQTMAGFGASDAWYAHYVGLFWPPAQREAAAQLLFNRTSGIGLSMWRYNMGSGSEGE